jgi:hypothetical protein
MEAPAFQPVQAQAEACGYQNIPLVATQHKIYNRTAVGNTLKILACPQFDLKFSRLAVGKEKQGLDGFQG